MLSGQAFKHGEESGSRQNCNFAKWINLLSIRLFGDTMFIKMFGNPQQGKNFMPNSQYDG